MYNNYALKQQLKVKKIISKPGNITLELSGLYIDKLFQYEIGKHQVQRQPLNDRNGRTHTSTVVVGLIKASTYKYITLKEEDIRIRAVRGTGPGGQARNRKSTCIEMTHIPTGLETRIDTRSQKQNKAEALKILTERVNKYYSDIHYGIYDNYRASQLADGGRTGKIRTYSFNNGFIHDHQLERKSTQIKEIMKGNLDLLIG